MSTIKRVRVEWSGGGLVGPGVSTFYFASGASGFLSDLATFFAAQNNRFSDQITWSCANTGDELDDSDGSITGVWTDGTQWTSTGSASGFWVAGTGGRVKWSTAGIMGNGLLPAKRTCVGWRMGFLKGWSA